MAYEVRLTDWALRFIQENVSVESTFSRFEWAVEILGEFPSFGHDYSPSYPAARPPFPCRCLSLSDTPFTLYYVVDSEAECVTIFDIEWSAGDPAKRFSGF